MIRSSEKGSPFFDQFTLIPGWSLNRDETSVTRPSRATANNFFSTGSDITRSNQVEGRKEGKKERKKEKGKKKKISS